MSETILQHGVEKLWHHMQSCLESEVAEEFLKTLLSLMQVMFVLDHDFRRNIENFEGRYLFTSKDGRIAMAATFARGRMHVAEKRIADPDITVTFRDGKSLIGFLLVPRQDVLMAMLNRRIQTAGNLNYVSKFGYMAKKLVLMMPRI